MEKKLDVLLGQLSEYLPLETQEYAKKQLIYIDDGDLFRLVQPLYKDCWENAALVLRNIGHPAYVI